MRSKPAHLTFLLLLVIAIAATACGSDSNDGSSPGSQSSDSPQATSTTGAPTVTPTPTPTPEPVFVYPEIVPELKMGDFWEYRWEFTDRSCAQGSGCNTDEEGGNFTVTLGDATTINGVTVFAVNVTGKHKADDGAIDLAPGWSHIGTDGRQIFGSNGSSLVPIFDALDGQWVGSGFFSRFSESETHAASRTVIQSQPFAAWPGVKSGAAVSVVRSDSQSMCEVIEGRRICPNDMAFSVSESQYYQADVGPFGYGYQFSASFSGGGFFSSNSTTENVALVASSLRGDVIEVQPTNVVPTPPPGQLPPRLGVPTPTPEIQLDVFYGPGDGSLTLVNINNQIPDFRTGVNLEVGVVSATFVNPDVGGSNWSYGITFRHSEEETFHAVYVTGNGRWQHFSRGGTAESQVSTALNPVAMNLEPGAENDLFVVFNVDEGAFFVNGVLVGELDLSTTNAETPGDVRVIAGVLNTDVYNGGESLYYDLTVLAP